MRLDTTLPQKLGNAQPKNFPLNLPGKVSLPTKHDILGKGFSVDEFRSSISQDSILKSSRHLQQFTLPKGLMSAIDPNDVRKVILRCDATSLPGISFATSEEIRRYGVGASERKPYLPVFGPVSCSYIVDGSGDIHSFFYDWMNFIIPFDSSKGMGAQNAFGLSPYELSYKDDYTSLVTILVYNELNNKIMEVTLFNAYPIGLDAVPLSWGSTDEFMKINVSWEYTDWSARYYDAKSSPDSTGFLEGIRRDINNIAGPAGPLGLAHNLASSLGLGNSVGNLIGRIGSASQRLTDIGNLVNGAKQTIIKSIKKRFGF